MRKIADCLWRIVFRAGFPVARACWRLCRPAHRGALVAVWAGRRLLLVRQSYRRALCFPGGGVRKGEQPRDAARRELVEEIGLHVAPEALEQVHQTTGIFDGRRDTVTFFELRLADEPALIPDNREITGAVFVESADAARLNIVLPVARYLAWKAAGPPGLSR